MTPSPHTWARGLAVAVLIGVTGLTWCSAPASAHAFLISSTPASGASVKASPPALRLVFSEDVVPRYARVFVIGADGQNLGGRPTVTGSVVTVSLRAGHRGSYTVRWQVVASDDGHTTEGAYSFGVDAQPLAPAPAHGISVPAAPELLAWLQFLGVVLVGGVLTVRALVVTPRRGARDGREPPDARAALWLAIAGAAVAVHAGVLAFLVGAYPIVGGGISGLVNTQIEPIRAGTHLGQAWTLTTFAWFGVLGLLVAAWATPRRRENLLACAGAAALVIAFGISWVSHPASRGSVALIADYVHLLAAALWVGGLIAVAIIATTARSLPDPARRAIARTSLIRFSQLALPTVAVVALVGLYLALRELPAPSALLGSSYGIILLIKGGVVVAALAVAAYHRHMLAPRAADGAPIASMRRTLALEIGLLLIALVLAASLSHTAPPS
jgi:copper transport protein